MVQVQVNITQKEFCVTRHHVDKDISKGGHQYWSLTSRGEVRRDEACLDHDGGDGAPVSFFLVLKTIVALSPCEFFVLCLLVLS